MKVTQTETQNKRILKFEGALIIQHAAKVHQELLPLVDADRDIELDLQGISECDTAGIQLLVAARKTAEKIGRQLSIQKIPPAVGQAMATAGISSDRIRTGSKDNVE